MPHNHVFVQKVSVSSTSYTDLFKIKSVKPELSVILDTSPDRMTKIKTKIDALYERAQEVLDMRK